MLMEGKNLQFLGERSNTVLAVVTLNVLLLDAQHGTDTPGAPLFMFIIEKYYLKLYSAYKVDFLLIRNNSNNNKLQSFLSTRNVKRIQN